MIVTLLAGFTFGFVGSMHMAGPIAVLLVVRSLADRYRSAYLIGIGSVPPEAIYAGLAYWGIASLLARHRWMLPVSHAVAAVLFLWLGMTLVRKRWEPKTDVAENRAGAGSFALGFVVSALNWSLIVAWTGATTALFSTELVAFTPGLAISFGFGAGAGILSWYFIVIGLIRRHKGRFSPAVLRRVTRGFGVVVLGLAVWFLWRFATAF